jgi:ABC-type multidrug transport system fused ATPase/permease subunit
MAAAALLPCAVCDALSLCGAKARFQLNFVPLVLALAYAAAFAAASIVLMQLQRRAERRTRSAAAAASASGKQATEHLTLPVATGDATPGKPAGAAAGRARHIGMTFAELSVVTASGAQLLRGASGTIPAGKVAALMGPSGCGKSTLLAALRTLGGDATGGRVDVTGVAAGTSDDDVARSIGYVPQEDVVDRTMTVRELLSFNARARAPASTSMQHVSGGECSCEQNLGGGDRASVA